MRGSVRLLRRFVSPSPKPLSACRRARAATSMAGAPEGACNAVQNPAELVCIVDEQNRVTGSATRAEMRAQNLTHR